MGNLNPIDIAMKILDSGKEKERRVYFTKGCRRAPQESVLEGHLAKHQQRQKCYMVVVKS